MREVAREFASAMRPARRLCIVMVCTDTSEADMVSRELSELDKGCLVTYRRTEDLFFNSPQGEVALVILADGDSPAGSSRTLRWLRNRWPRCPIMIVGDEGCGDHEMSARQGGAIFLTRPVARDQWAAMLSHVLTPDKQKVDERDRSAGGIASRADRGR